MLIQSLVLTVFSLVLATLCAYSALSEVHNLAITAAQQQLRSSADLATERARISANQASPSIPSDSTDPSTGISTHIALDPSPNLANDLACPGHDLRHRCNLVTTATASESRVWETLDLHTSALTGERLSLRRHVLLRVLPLPPYATVVAIRDDATSGGALLGDPSGIPAAAGDLTTPDPNNPGKYHDTRIHLYEPCRFVTNNSVVATDHKNWANWQGGTAGPARQLSCDAGAGETSQYTNTTVTTPPLTSSSWGH